MYSKFVCQTYGQTRAQSGDGKQDRLLIDIIQKSAKKRRCVCVCGGGGGLPLVFLKIVSHSSLQGTA